MRLNRWVLLASFIVGGLGAWAMQNAVRTYLDATEAFTEVELHYRHDSFVWLDEQYENGQGELEIVNNSTYPVRIERFSIFLDFDGDFAGADYNDWQAVEIAPSETYVFLANFTVTANTIQDRGGAADLRLRGQMGLEFNQFKRELTIPFQSDIGQASENGS